MAAKRKLTDEEWIEMGELLQQARDITIRASVIAGKGVRKKGDGLEHVQAATESLDRARNRLEEAMFSKGGPKCTHVFYGGAPPRRECEHPNCGEYPRSSQATLAEK